MISGPEAGRTLLWLTNIDALPDTVLFEYCAWLGRDEQQRLASFRRGQRRRQFVAGRTLLRLALASLLRVEPWRIRLAERPGAAPLLMSPVHDGVGFSISHSGAWVGCAVNATSRVGLDIEAIDPGRDLDGLAEHAFSAADRAWLASRPPESRVRDFYALWSSAEARFKLGAEPAATFEIAHEHLSIALCCEHVPSCPPSLELVALGPSGIGD